MSFNYTTVLIAGVPLNEVRVQTGVETRYDQVTGEPIDRPVFKTQLVTESGVVYDNSYEDMTDEEIDDWINPNAGDFCYVGGEAKVHGLGVMIATHDPKYEDAPNKIDNHAIPSYIEKAITELGKIGITDDVKLMLLSEVH